ncbi:MAG: hypothetical protein QF569_14975 [Candidatus Poribacteria bacterium]|nr:hypothetical protein [Candidatus Poribacteria bacterium]
MNLLLFPNWTSHAIMTSSMYIVPPIACEKTVISLSITLLPLALFYFLYGIDWERMRFGLGLVGFIYTFISLPAPYMEFYNFALSMSTLFFTFGYRWRHKMDLTLPRLSLLLPTANPHFFLSFSIFFAIGGSNFLFCNL